MKKIVNEPEIKVCPKFSLKWAHFSPAKTYQYYLYRNKTSTKDNTKTGTKDSAKTGTKDMTKTG